MSYGNKQLLLQTFPTNASYEKETFSVLEDVLEYPPGKDKKKNTNKSVAYYLN